MLSFEWEPKDKAEPQLGSVGIKNTASGKTVQVLDNVERYSADTPFGTQDLNNDGCRDLVVTSSVAGIGNESKTVFLYSPKKRRFVLSDALSAIGGLEIDPRDKNCVTGSWKGGAADFYSAKHCWSKGKLMLRSEASVSPMLREDGGLNCYQHVNTEYRAGKKRTRKDCTGEF